MPVFHDQTGRTITINQPPRRIISLVPSQTELLADLGLENEVVGITKFCVHPESWFRNKPRVGGTKQLRMDTIRNLQPDLIIANKEENTREQVEALTKEYLVWISDVTNLDSALEMIKSVGEIVYKEDIALQLITSIKSAFSSLRDRPRNLRAAYLIWKDPLMSVGHDTFIHSMMVKAGFSNVFENKTRYPETSIEELLTLQPEILLLSSEPYPFKEKHIKEMQAEIPGTQILLVDGEMFSWYGSRLRYAPEYFKKLNPLST